MSTRALRKGVAHVLQSADVDARISFVWDGVEYAVAPNVVRHLEAKCPVIPQARESLAARSEKLDNTAELGATTARCTGGCWSRWEAAEQRAIAAGDERKRGDWEEDGVRRRVRLARWITDGLIAGEGVGPVGPPL